MSFFTLVFRPGFYNPYLFSDLASKKLCHHFLDKNSNKKRFLKINFEVAHFSFFLDSFGIEMMTTFIHSHSSLENRTRFQTKMGKVYTCVQTKTAQKPYPLGQHIPTWLTWGSFTPSPAPGGFEVLASFLFFF